MSDSFNGEHLREVMRNVASPVTVVTYLDGDLPRGVTIGSFTSVSLDPPLISFNISSESSAHDVLPFVDRLNVNVLSTAQAHVASHFALSGLSSELQFAPSSHTMMRTEFPVLSEAVATLFCGRVESCARRQHDSRRGSPGCVTSSGRKPAPLLPPAVSRGW
jgi:3-hydroxy-9,10-secoandrosta-1,3,5(10)-triene-9,17-dione monooxygenase reductase component